MTPDLKKFEEKRRQSLLETIGSTVWMGVEDLVRMIGFGKSSSHKTSHKKESDQISLQLDKFETKKMNKTK